MRAHLLAPIALLSVIGLAAPGAAAPKVTPGQWQSTINIDSISMPGMPPEALAMLKNRPAITTSYCLTPQEAEANPEKVLATDKNCKMNRFRFEAGEIDAEMSCKTDQGPATMTMKGSFAADSYQMNTRMVSGPMTMVSRVSARRLGPCK